MDLIAELGRLRLIPVITLHDANDAERLGATLLEAGLPCAGLPEPVPRFSLVLRKGLASLRPPAL